LLENREYTIGSIYQPDEHVLELSRGHLLELNDALKDQHGKAARVANRDFTIWPMPTDVLQEMRRLREQTEGLQRKTQWGQPSKPPRLGIDKRLAVMHDVVTLSRVPPQ
jgi:hypothetical protein